MNTKHFLRLARFLSTLTLLIVFTTATHAQDEFYALEEAFADTVEPSVDSDISFETLELIDESELLTDSDDSVSFGDWLGYNSTQSDMTWLAGDEFGLFSMESFPTLELGEESNLVLGTGIHFSDGPLKTDLPPRLFDVRLAYHTRKSLFGNVSLDLNLGVGVFTDFEGSSRKGVRFPGHAVTYHEWSPRFVSVLGVESFDRDDISVLPVVGIVWRPTDDMVWELVFPRPKLHLKLDSGRALYIGGEMGGGTWAIERTDSTNDNVTYRDLRVVVGVKHFEDDDGVFEIGWAFDRLLEYRSGRGDHDPQDALILRVRTHF